LFSLISIFNLCDIIKSFWWNLDTNALFQNLWKIHIKICQHVKKELHSKYSYVPLFQFHLYIYISLIFHFHFFSKGVTNLLFKKERNKYNNLSSNTLMNFTHKIVNTTHFQYHVKGIGQLMWWVMDLEEHFNSSCDHLLCKPKGKIACFHINFLKVFWESGGLNYFLVHVTCGYPT
jgi:hypothetical protein